MFYYHHNHHNHHNIRDYYIDPHFILRKVLSGGVVFWDLLYTKQPMQDPKTFPPDYGFVVDHGREKFISFANWDKNGLTHVEASLSNIKLTTTYED